MVFDTNDRNRGLLWYTRNLQAVAVGQPVPAPRCLRVASRRALHRLGRRGGGRAGSPLPVIVSSLCALVEFARVLILKNCLPDAARVRFGAARQPESRAEMEWSLGSFGDLCVEARRITWASRSMRTRTRAANDLNGSADMRSYSGMLLAIQPAHARQLAHRCSVGDTRSSRLSRNPSGPSAV
jgi:hypothetical protein